MPELQAAAERLEAALAGAVAERVAPLSVSALKTFDPPLGALVGTSLAAVHRRGKYLILDFTSLVLVTHLMQSGRIMVTPRAPARPRGGLLVVGFGDRGDLLLKELASKHRASVWLLRSEALGAFEPIATLGPEADGITEEELRSGLGAKRRQVHGFLRNQRAIAGIGRAWANDILNLAQISPLRMTTELTDDEVRRLHGAIDAVLGAALVEQRSRTVPGLPDKVERTFRVHNRLGEPCPGCGGRIEHVSFEGYEIFYCPVCQTGGRVLADRRLSRLIK
jgi:formamidopyrimidine-DNA glycosylase